MINNKWTWSRDAQTWGHEAFLTREEALADAKADMLEEESLGGRKAPNGVYLGQTKTIPMPKLTADLVLEILGEDAEAEFGDIADFYLSDVPQAHKDELEEEINAVIHRWAEKNGHLPDFYTIHNIMFVEF